MSDRPDMVDVKQLSGIDIQDSITYLGVKIFCDRQRTCQSIKDQTKKYMAYNKGRIQTKNVDLMSCLFAAFYRSMMIYFLTPLYTAVAITEKEVESMEI